MWKRFSAIVCLFSAVCGAALITARTSTAVPAAARHTTQQTVIIDAGHGGFDGGAVAQDGTVEKEINLKIALMLRAFLKQAGYEVIMTRESDMSTERITGERIASRKKSDMQARLDMMRENPEAIFVSIHLNKFTTSAASGAQIFFSPNSPASAQLGDAIRRAIGVLQPENRRSNKQATDSTFLLYRAPIPAVLVECGFLSNAPELALLKSEEYQQKMAFVIFCGIRSYLIEQAA